MGPLAAGASGSRGPHIGFSVVKAGRPAPSPREDAAAGDAALESSISAFGSFFQIGREKIGCCFLFHYCICLLGVLPPAIASILFWSSIGYGQECLDRLQRLTEAAYATASGLLLAVCALYMLDFFWPPHMQHKYCQLGDTRSVGAIILVALAVGVVLVCFMMASTFPWLPLVLTCFSSPLIIAGIRAVKMRRRKNSLRKMRSFQPEIMPSAGGSFDGPPELRMQIGVLRHVIASTREEKTFYQAVAAAWFSAGMMLILIWSMWVVFYEEHFDEVHKASHAEREEHLILWLAPLLAAIAFFSFSVLAALRVHYGDLYARTDDCRATQHALATWDWLGQERQRKAKKPAQKGELRSRFGADLGHRPQRAQREHYLHDHQDYMRQLQFMVKVLACVLLLLLAGSYVAFVLVTESQTLVLMVQAFLLMLFMLSLAFVYFSFWRVWRTMVLWLLGLPLLKSIARLAGSDWARAAGLFAFGPLAPILLLASALNQRVRCCRGLCPPEDRKLLLTQRAHRFVEHAKEWNWVAVLPRVYFLALVAIVYVLTPLILNVFLSWMISQLESLSMGLILVAVWLVGMILFLLPPVPGAPVYLFGGVLVSGKGAQDWGECAGFYIGSALCILVCWLLKLSACFMQQVFIGQWLGSHQYVRQTIGVHKPFIRALEYVLSRPGLSFGKVVILCGGPDWPTSVLAGVLRLSVVQCEIGTMPILFYITPLSLTGSFYYKRDASEVWQNLGDLMFTTSALMTVALWVAIGWVVQDAFDKELENFTKPKAEFVELDWLDYREERIAKRCFIRWDEVPCWVKLPFAVGSITLVLLGHLFYWLEAVFFGTFDISADVGTLSWYGKDASVIRPAGLVGLGLTGIGCLGWLGFSMWSWFHMRGPRAAAIKEVDSEKESWTRQRLSLVEAATKPTAYSPEKEQSLDPEATVGDDADEESPTGKAAEEILSQGEPEVTIRDEDRRGTRKNTQDAEAVAELPSLPGTPCEERQPSPPPAQPGAGAGASPVAAADAAGPGQVEEEPCPGHCAAEQGESGRGEHPSECC